LKKSLGIAWAALIWLGIKTSGGVLWMWQWNFGFDTMRGISLLT